MAAGRQATWDAYCHSFMLLALWGLVAGWGKSGHGQAIFVLAGFCMGLSFMSKGPVSFYALLLPFMLARWLVFGLDAVRPRWSPALLTVTALLAVAAPWPLFVLASNSGQAAATLQTEAASWGTRHVKGLMYYANFPFMTGIWSLPTLAALVSASAKMRDGRNRGRLFCFLWLVLTLALLSVVPEKKERYLLPALVPLAMLVGDYLQTLLQAAREGRLSRIDKSVLRLHTGVLIVLSLAVPVTAAIPAGFGFGFVQLMTLSVAMIFFTGLAAVFASSLRQVQVQRILTATIVLVAASWVLLPPLLAPAGFPKHHYRPLRALRNETEVQDLELHALESIDERMVWYAGRPIASLSATQGRPHTLPVALLSEKPLVDIPEGIIGRPASIRPVAAYCMDESTCDRKLHLYIIE